MRHQATRPLVIPTFVLLVAATSLTLAAATAAIAAPNKPRQIRVEYVRPANPAHQPIHNELKRARALERMQALLAPIRLPLLLKVAGCDGDANAWYDEGEIRVCYEYIEEIMKIAPEKDPPIGITKRDTIVGPLVDLEPLLADGALPGCS